MPLTPQLKSTRKTNLLNMSIQHVEALSQSKRLERLSDQNLVKFYENELWMIDKGERAAKLLNSNVLRRLIGLGILKKEKWRGRGRRGLSLTERARDLMEKR